MFEEGKSFILVNIIEIYFEMINGFKLEFKNQKKNISSMVHQSEVEYTIQYVRDIYVVEVSRIQLTWHF